MFGPDPSLIKFANEFGEVINQMNLKMTGLWRDTQSIDIQLINIKDILKEILDEIKEKDKIAISENNAKYIQGKSKVYDHIYPKAHLDEIINNSLSPLIYQLEILNEKMEKLNQKM
jgi:hypothetical protein